MIKVYGKKADYLTYEHRHGSIVVHAWGRYPDSSVLAGQPCKQFLDSFETVEEALAAYPEAEGSHPLFQPQVSLNHLPDGPDDDYFDREDY